MAICIWKPFYFLFSPMNQMPNIEMVRNMKLHHKDWFIYAPIRVLYQGMAISCLANCRSMSHLWYHCVRTPRLTMIIPDGPIINWGDARRVLPVWLVSPLASLCGIGAAGKQKTSTTTINEATPQPAHKEKLTRASVAKCWVTKEQPTGGPRQASWGKEGYNTLALVMVYILERHMKW